MGLGKRRYVNPPPYTPRDCSAYANWHSLAYSRGDQRVVKVIVLDVLLSRAHRQPLAQSPSSSTLHPFVGRQLLQTSGRD
jgi:hypothetical protein